MSLFKMGYKKTKTVSAGKVLIGGDNRITVQTMWKKSLHGFSYGDLEEIRRLEEFGCDILRFSVPDIRSAEVLADIKGKTGLTLVSDIHFDYKLALECIKSGIDKVRINPGNIGADWKVREVLTAADSAGIPIRIGINSGSLPRELSGMEDKAAAMLLAAENEIDLLHRFGFGKAVFSLKSSDTASTLRANREFSEKYDYPLHLGVTEAGPLTAGLVKTSIALAQLLSDGIGSTIRVSLTDSPEQEVIAGREILKACGLDESGVRIISCPRCGRSTFDTHKFISQIYEELYKIRKPLSVAVMGCVVNGPGEAAEADLGITGAGNSIVIFKHGKLFAKVDENKGREEFLKLLHEMSRD